MQLLANAARLGMPLTHPAAVDALARPEYVALMNATCNQIIADNKAADEAAEKRSKGRR